MTSNLIPNAKSLYVGGVRLLEPLAHWTGLLSWLGRASQKHRLAHWLRSLFAIHDIDALIALDVPWWTYEAIARTEAFLNRTPEARVFEYGSGASTVWLARRAGSVVSVEHDESWHCLVASRLATLDLASGLEHRLVPPVPADAGTARQYLSQKPGHAGLSFETYATAILREGGLFDLIVIDGRARNACLQHAMTRLAPGGLILFDNSGRSRYRAAIEGSGMVARRFRGLTPSLPYFEETTVMATGTQGKRDDAR
jgi:hypothetical protein